jgi:hypothetical protein
MATTIVTKSGSGAPTASNLVAGELAVDLTNKRLYTENSSGTVLEVGSNPYNFTANHDGSAKLATTATGIDVTGAVTASAGITATTGTFSGNVASSSGMSITKTGVSAIAYDTKTGTNASSAAVTWYDGVNVFATDGSYEIKGTTGNGLTLAPTTGAATFSAGITATTGTFSGNITKSVAPAANGGIVVNDGTNDLIALGTGGFGVNGGAATDGGIRAYNNLLFGTGSSSTERMRIDSSGNVGISESNPVAKIHIKGSGTSGQVTSSLILENSSSGTAGLQITGTAGSSHLDFMYGGGPSTGTNTLTTGMSMTLEGSGAGNVGIGVSPSTKLHVLGGRSTFYSGDNYAVGVGNASGVLGGYMGSPAVNVLSFSEPGGAERMRIDASGHAIIPAGVTLGTAAGVYAAANTLEDYEEGTWTPTITNSTGSYTTQVGRYTKIGNLVYVNCNVNTAFTNTGTTAQSIAGLPFASENVASLFSVGTIFPVQGFNQGNSDIAAQVTINTTSVALYTVAPATGINYTTIVSNTFGTTVEFEFSLCYRTA